MAARWSFLTNHARVLLCIAHDPGLRLRDMATELGITERSAYGIVADLTRAGYVRKERDGRRNRYSIQREMPLPDLTNRERTVGELLNLLAGPKPGAGGAARTTRPAPAKSANGAKRKAQPRTRGRV